MPGSVKCIAWQEDDMGLGYRQDDPDYWTQGTRLENLQKHLADITLISTQAISPACAK